MRNWKKNTVRIVLFLCAIGLTTYIQSDEKNVLAENVNQTAAVREYGANYWTTSYVREWLNQDGAVQYSNDFEFPNNEMPHENGFLSHFYESERENILVTERRQPISNPFGSLRDGGESSQRFINQGATKNTFPQSALNMKMSGDNLNDIWHIRTNEKVFIMSAEEHFGFVHTNGLSSERDIDRYWVNTPRYDGADSGMFYFSKQNSVGSPMFNIHGSTRLTLGVYPSLHVSPNAIFRDGTHASNVSIGDIVEFGPYKWEVIHLSGNNEDIPLLWSLDNVDNVRFSYPTENLQRYSYIDFEEYDVSIFDIPADDRPHIEMEDSELFEYQEDSFSIKLHAESDSGMSHWVLPHGEIVYQDSIEYAFTDNDGYDFFAVDNNNRYMGLHVPVSNIYHDPSIEVTKTPNTSNWINEDVLVDIRSSEANLDFAWDYWFSNSRGNDVRNYAGYLHEDGTTSGRMPSSTIYAGKRFRWTGEIRVRERSANPPSINFSLRHSRLSKIEELYRTSISWGNDYRINAGDVPLNEWISVDETVTLPGSTGDEVTPYLVVTNNVLSNRYADVEFRNIRLEVLDDSDFGIESIRTPDGVVYPENDHYTEVLTETGEYVFEIEDNRGLTTTEVIEVNIDKTSPILNTTID